MAVIRAQRVPKSKIKVDDLLYLFVYKFPQYTYSQAEKLPYKRVIEMLNTARREDARFMYELTQIVASPHTKKGSGVKKVLEYYKGIMEDNNG